MASNRLALSLFASVARVVRSAAAWEPNPLHGMVTMMTELCGVALHHIESPAFDEVPVGLSAMTSAPGTYGFVALRPLGCREPAVCQQDAKKDACGFGDPVGFGQYTEDVHCKEPNDVRMAMCAVLGVGAADLLIWNVGIQQICLGCAGKGCG